MNNTRIWSVADTADGHENEIAAIASSLGILPLTAGLLFARGYRTAEDAKKFLRVEEEQFYDPFLLKDMDKAVRRIGAALKNGEKIVIFGDYDVDGVTSVSMLYLYMKNRGADVEYYIPNRIGEGYGMNRDAVGRLADDGCRLMITVDTGITAVDEIAFAAERGVDVIVTDHHSCRELLPDACAVVNPRRSDDTYPFKELAGVGVVFKLISALEAASVCESGEAREYLRRICENYIDLAALGTVADVMPLTGENRLIVSLGLRFIAETKRPGLAALIAQAAGGKNGTSAKKITSTLIGFTLAPRINAAGRISHAGKAVELFLTDSRTEGERIAAELCDTNRERQNEENAIIEQAKEKIAQLPDLSENPVIVLDDDNWHHGVIGIVSSRITEHYNLPSILISFDGDVGKGSGRSIRGLNLVEALNACSDLLLRFGGHELAAGLSIERKNLAAFRDRINAYARERLKPGENPVKIDIDCETQPGEITLRQAKELYLLEPYGVSNPVPLFLLSDAKIAELSPIGNGKHTRMTLACGNQTFSAVCFGTVCDDLDFEAGDSADVLYNLNVNEFRGNETAQLLIRDLRHTKACRLREREEKEHYLAILSSDGVIPAVWDAVPERSEFAAVYLYIKRETRMVCRPMTLHKLEEHFRREGVRMTYPKLRFIIDILTESGLLQTESSDNRTNDSAGMEAERFLFRLKSIETKVNLDQSTLYRHLKERAEKSERV